MHSQNHIFPSLKYYHTLHSHLFCLTILSNYFYGKHIFVMNSYISFTHFKTCLISYSSYIKSFLISFQIIFLQIYTSERIIARKALSFRLENPILSSLTVKRKRATNSQLLKLSPSGLLRFFYLPPSLFPSFLPSFLPSFRFDQFNDRQISVYKGDAVSRDVTKSWSARKRIITAISFSGKKWPSSR